MRSIRSLLVLSVFVPFFLFSCYNYISEDVPIIARPDFKQQIAILTIKVSTPENDKTKREITAIYTKYLMETGYFGRVLSDGVRANHHIDLYTSEVNEYEHFWISSISTLFMLGTAGLLPSIYSKERVLHADFYLNDKLVGREKYRQKHSTLFGIPFVFIWEAGIKEAKTIHFNKEKNLIHNVVQDYNRYL
ncbi:hypothetical protein JWG41_07270 [Leptospira sp. 201903075]|uniref:hypothetical protein n=1 Tax=Leptospira chreensis TaxID=2810035 RepID=UPI00196429C3|nr:hypothetical protein [Leptospira chreensis]MBM9590239.1 hypothetical protein [Leptospira chreensis]